MKVKIGSVYGNLTVIEMLDLRGTLGYYYKCLCVCGKEREVRGTYLTIGRVISCGCQNKKRNIAVNIGDAYGRLQVLEYVNSTNDCRNYRCLCECGEEIIVKSKSLAEGKTRSCGCLKKEWKRPPTVSVGETYGRLTVIECLGVIKKDRGRYYKCICVCGNYHTVIGRSLKNGACISCGCSRIPDEPWKISANGVYRKYSDGDITFDQFIELTQQNCHYCGTPSANMVKPSKQASAKTAHLYIWKYNGLDRIDPLQNHNINNVVPCCGDCNYAKSNLSYDEFLSLIRKIYHHRAKIEKENNE